MNNCEIEPAAECEFSYLTEPHAATRWNMDYLVCDEHDELATDAIHSRTDAEVKAV